MTHSAMSPTIHGVEILQPIKVQHVLTHIQSPRPLLNHTFFIDSDPDDATDSAEELFEDPFPNDGPESPPTIIQIRKPTKKPSRRSSRGKKKRKPRRKSDANSIGLGSQGPQMLRNSLESTSDCEGDDLPSSPKINGQENQTTDVEVPPIPERFQAPQPAQEDKPKDVEAVPPSRTSTPKPVTAIEPAVAELDQNEVRTWSTERVATWLQSSGFGDEIVTKFRSNDIDGPALLDLHIKDLKELNIRSFGKRHAIWNELRALRVRDGAPPLPTPEDSERSDAESITALPVAEKVVPRRHSTRRRSVKRNRAVLSRTLSDSSVQPSGSPTQVITPAPLSIAASSDMLGPGTCPTHEFVEDLLHLYSRDPQDDVIDFMENRHAQRAKIQQATISLPENCAELPVPDPEESKPRPIPKSPREVAPIPAPEEAPAPVDPPAPTRVAPTPPTPITTQFPPRSSSRANMIKSASAFPTHSVMNSSSSSRVPSPSMNQRNPSPTFSQRAPSPSINSRGPSPSMSSRGPSPSMNQRGPSPTLSQRAPSPSLNARPILSLRSPASDSDVPVLSPFQSSFNNRASSQSLPADIQFQHPVFRSLTPSPVSPERSESPSSPRVPYNRHMSFSTNVNGQRRPLALLPTLSERNTMTTAAEASTRSHAPGSIRSIPRNTTPRTPGVSRGHTMKPLPRAPHAKRPTSVLSVPRELPVSTANAYQASAIYGPGTVRAGWVRKRRNRLWRHEWQEHHFRLQGTRLALHSTAKPKDTIPYEIIDVEGYAVACSSIGRGGRLATAMKTLRIGSRDAEKAYAWQLVPSTSTGERAKRRTMDVRHSRKSSLGGCNAGELKTHHFSVKTRDERIEWMREVMLAKAVKQRQTGQVDKEKDKKSLPRSPVFSRASEKHQAISVPLAPSPTHE